MSEPTVKGGVVLNIATLIDDANAEPEPRPYIGIQGLLPVIDILYQKKNFTFNNIRQWLEDRGIFYTTPHIQTQYRRWEEIQAGIKEAMGSQDENKPDAAHE